MYVFLCIYVFHRINRCIYLCICILTAEFVKSPYFQSFVTQQYLLQSNVLSLLMSGIGMYVAL